MPRYKGTHGNKGKRRSLETRRKISKAMKGKKHAYRNGIGIYKKVVELRSKCELAGFTDYEGSRGPYGCRGPLECHHIDGDRMHNCDHNWICLTIGDPEEKCPDCNLQVLCVQHHMLVDKVRGNLPYIVGRGVVYDRLIGGRIIGDSPEFDWGEEKEKECETA